jgi:hypothetical protein
VAFLNLVTGTLQIVFSGLPVGLLINLLIFQIFKFLLTLLTLLLCGLLEFQKAILFNPKLTPKIIGGETQLGKRLLDAEHFFERCAEFGSPEFLELSKLLIKHVNFICGLAQETKLLLKFVSQVLTTEKTYQAQNLALNITSVGNG